MAENENDKLQDWRTVASLIRDEMNEFKGESDTINLTDEEEKIVDKYIGVAEDISQTIEETEAKISEGGDADTDSVVQEAIDELVSKYGEEPEGVLQGMYMETGDIGDAEYEKDIANNSDDIRDRDAFAVDEDERRQDDRDNSLETRDADVGDAFDDEQDDGEDVPQEYGGDAEASGWGDEDDYDYVSGSDY